MAKKKLGLIGVGVSGGALLFAVIFSVVLSGSSQSEFTALSDEAMANLLGGADKKKGDKLQDESQTGNINCDVDCSSTMVYEPEIYKCVYCPSGHIKAYDFEINTQYTWTCDGDVPGQCPEKCTATGYYTLDCSEETSTTC